MNGKHTDYDDMKKLNVAVLSGGVSSEREVSIKSGRQVFEALDKDKYHAVQYDPKTDLQRLVKDAPEIHAALIILHGSYGEDGTIQGLLDLLNIPYQGAGVLGSALAMNKAASKQLYKNSGLKIPEFDLLRKEAPSYNRDAIVDKIGLPLVVKPASGGSSIGMSIVRSIEDIDEAVTKAFDYDSVILFETYIKGVELTGGVIGNEDLEALPIIEIIPDPSHEFFDFEAKYTAGVTQEICPARIDDELTKKAQEYAKIAHKALFCKGYSRTDMILRGNDIFVLETNTIPGMTPTSLFPLAAKTYGYTFGQLLDRLIELSLENHAE